MNLLNKYKELFTLAPDILLDLCKIFNTSLEYEKEATYQHMENIKGDFRGGGFKHTYYLSNLI